MSLPLSAELIKTGLFNELEDLSDTELENHLPSPQRLHPSRVPRKPLGNISNTITRSLKSRYRRSSLQRTTPPPSTLQLNTPLSPESDPASDVWTEMKWAKPHGDHNSKKRAAQRDERICKMSKCHTVFQSTCWELEDGRRTSTAYKGRPDLILKDCAEFSSDDSAAERIAKLKSAGYEFREVG
jgi:hypothetical protein